MAVAEVDTRVVTVEEVLDGHVTLEIESLDRIYLNLYVPTLQVSGQAATFLGRHSGNPIPSPAIMEQRGNRFRIAVRSFAEANAVPVVHFAKDERKIDTVRPLLEAAEAAGRSRVVAIGVAQEYQRVFSASKGETGQGAVWSDFYKADRRVTCYYFYVWDQDFGPGFIKLCAYFPYPGRVWVNGHEWAKRQAARAGIEFAALSNGFADCADPAGLQEICDRLGPGQIHAFVERWLARIPLPLDGRDREAGYRWQALMRQIETSRTLVFDTPARARAFFEALIADNLDIGRPSNVEVLFKGSLAGRKSTPPANGYRTAIDREADGVVVNVFWKHSRIKQYLKDGRALRIETVVNHPRDLAVLRRLEHLDELQAKARRANQRLLRTERAGQNTVLGSPAFARVSAPTVEDGGQRAPALRFGDPRVMALAGALAAFAHTITGTFTDKSLRAVVTTLSATDYTTARMSYDLRRLRLKGLIERIPRSNAYRITDDGLRFAVFYTKLHDRLLTPLLDTDQPPPPRLGSPDATHRPLHRPDSTTNSLTRDNENLPQTTRSQIPKGLGLQGYIYTSEPIWQCEASKTSRSERGAALHPRPLGRLPDRGHLQKRPPPGQRPGDLPRHR
jgi:hypothetical protein